MFIYIKCRLWLMDLLKLRSLHGLFYPVTITFGWRYDAQFFFPTVAVFYYIYSPSITISVYSALSLLSFLFGIVFVLLLRSLNFNQFLNRRGCNPHTYIYPTFRFISKKDPTDVSNCVWKVIELLGAVSLLPEGHIKVLEALTAFRSYAGELRRWQVLHLQFV